jgi:hypothetical protein
VFPQGKNRSWLVWSPDRALLEELAQTVTSENAEKQLRSQAWFSKIKEKQVLGGGIYHPLSTFEWLRNSKSFGVGDGQGMVFDKLAQGMNTSTPLEPIWWEVHQSTGDNSKSPGKELEFHFQVPQDITSQITSVLAVVLNSKAPIF